MATRTLTAAVTTELAKRRVAPVYLFDLEFDSGTTYLWSGVGDLVWNGNTYQGAGNLLDFNPPAETTDVRAEGAQVSLSGIPAAWISTALAEPYQGRTAKQYLGFIDDTGSLINDPITLFTGRMDQMQIEEEGDTSTIAVTLESNLIDLNKPRERRYTDQDQKSDYPNDRGFEYVAGLQGKSLTWGPDTRSPRQRTQDIARIREDVTLQRRTTRGYNTLRTTTTSAVDDEGNVLESFSETTGSPGGR